MSTFDDSFDDSVAPHVQSTQPFDDDDYEQFPPVYGDFENGDGPVLPPPSEMAEEGFALREWRRENAMRLEEKERVEKEMLSRILEEAEEYKVEFYKKREVNCEYAKGTNREREKVIVAGLEKFHADADKDYWKAIAELVPKEVPTLEKKRGKKDQENKPGITVIQGPKPGKPTDLARMRHILLKLKHSTPVHLKHSPPPPDAKTSDAADVVATPEPVAVA